MTFIASVVARDGVAIIADSLVTTSRYVIELEDFIEYSESVTTANGKVNIDIDDLISLFTIKSSHTRDFEEKIFEYDDYTVITTAGNANINGMTIKGFVDKKKHINAGYEDYESMTTLEKINDFGDFLRSEIRNHFTQPDTYVLGSTTFIFTHFDKLTKDTEIHKVFTIESSREKLQDAAFDPVRIPAAPESAKIVCDGQNRISNGILYGGVFSVVDAVHRTVRKLEADFKIPAEHLTEEYIEDLESTAIGIIQEDIQLRKISELSLQQAVDLAALLMRIEIDFQKYTANIPTVGGVVKIATISQTGIEWVAGNKILRPTMM